MVPNWKGLYITEYLHKEKIYTNPSWINPNSNIPNKPLRPNIVKAKVG